MAVPKHKMSRRRTHARRAQWKAKPIELVEVHVRGRSCLVPKNLVPAVRRGLVEPPVRGDTL